MRQVLLLAAGCVLLGTIFSLSAAALDVVASGYLSGNDVHYPGKEATPAIAYGNEKFVSVWSSTRDVESAGADWDLFYSVSEDGGVNWSSAALLHTDMSTDSTTDKLPSIATDGNGKWMVAWISGSTFLYSVATDRDWVWEAPETLPTLAGTPIRVTLQSGSDLWYANVAIRGTTSFWVPFSSDYVLRSPIQELVWTSEHVESRTGSASQQQWLSTLAVGENGIAVACQITNTMSLETQWQAEPSAHWASRTVPLSGTTNLAEDMSLLWSNLSGDFILAFSKSSKSDLALTRSATGFWWVQDYGLESQGVLPGSRNQPRLAAGPDGMVVATYSAVPKDPGNSQERNIYFSASSDSGYTWGDAALLNPSGTLGLGLNDLNAAVSTSGTGHWIGLWLEPHGQPTSTQGDTNVCFGVLSDDAPPRVTVLRPLRRDYAEGDIAEVAIALSKPVNGFQASALTINAEEGIHIGIATLSGADASYRLHIPILDGTGLIQVGLNQSAVVTDENGQAWEPDNRTAQFVVDDSPMRLESITRVSPATMSSGETFVADLQFSSAPLGFDINDLEFLPPGVLVSDFVKSGSSPVRISAKVLLADPNAAATEYTLKLSDHATITDVDGNAVAQSLIQASWTILPDPMTLQSMTIVGDDQLLSGETATAFLEFSDDPIGFGIEDLAFLIPGGEAENIQLTGTGTSREVRFVPRLNPNISSSVNCVLSLSENAAATNSIGNGLAASGASVAWEVEPAPLVLVSLSRVGPEAIESGSTITAEFEFSEEPLGFGLEDIEVNALGCKLTIVKLTASGLTWTYKAKVIIEDPASPEVECRIGLSDDAAASNGLGNGLTPSAQSVSWTISPDPLRVLSMKLLSESSLNTGEELVVELTFSENPVSLDLEDFRISSDSFITTATRLTALTSTKYLFGAYIYPEKSDLSQVNCTFAFSDTASVTDPFGNPLLLPMESIEFHVIAQPLFVTSIVPRPGSLKNGMLITGTQPSFDINFNRPVLNFTLESMILDYVGSASHGFRLVGASGAASYRLEMWDLFVESGITIGVIPSQALHSPTNNQGLQEAFSLGPISVVKPFKIETYAWRDVVTEIDEIAILDIEFTRPVSGLALENFYVNLGDVTADVELTGEAHKYVLRLSNLSGEGSVTVALPPDPAIRDEFDFTYSGTKSATVDVIDDVLPVLESIMKVTDSQDPNYKLLFTFDEPVTDFDIHDLDILLEGFTLSNSYVEGGATEYTLHLVNLVGQGKLTVMPGASFSVVAEDGDVNTTGNGRQYTVSMTRIPPQLVSIVRSATQVLPGEDFVATYTFDKPVSGVKFAVAHQGTAHASLSTSVEGSAYTITLQELQGEGQVQISLDPTSIIRDLAGNHFLNSGTSISFGVGIPPLLLDSLTRLTSASTKNGPAVFEFTFSEPVVNFDLEDLVITSDGTAVYGSAEITGDGAVYALTLDSLTGDGSFFVTINPQNDIESTGGVVLTATLASSLVRVDPDSVSVSQWLVLNPIVLLFGRANLVLEFDTLVTGLDGSEDFVIDSVLEGSGQIEVLAAGGQYQIKVGPILEEGLVGIALNPEADIRDLESNPLADMPPMLYFIVDDPATEFQADLDGNFVLELDELLRAIQFYNAQRFGCASGTEDGFTPNGANENCAPHASDFAPQDWTLSLGELLRLIQMFNAGGYYPCPNENPPGEDGHCAFDWINAPAP